MNIPVNTLVKLAFLAFELDKDETLGDALRMSEEQLNELCGELRKIINDNETLVLEQDLKTQDVNASVPSIRTQIYISEYGISLQPEGYSDYHGDEPILLDVYEGKPKVCIWNHENEDPVHKIELTPMPKKTWDVPVCRIGYAHTTIEVEAATEAEALRLADDMAGGISFSEHTSEYKYPDGAIEKV